MLTNVRISAQYYENYSDNPETPYWKPKGGAEFMLKGIDSDSLYFTEEVEQTFKVMLEEKSNSHCKYEFIDYEMVYEPEELSVDEFEWKLNNILRSQN